VLTRTGSAASAGTIAFVMGMAALAGTLAGGLVTDRIGGRRVSILADSLSLITALTLAVVLWLDAFSLWLVAVTQVLGVFFDGPGHIGKVSMVPAAAEEEGVPMTRAMGLTQTLQGMATFVGPITAGLLIAAFGEANTLLVTTVLFLMSIVLASRLRKQVLTHEHPMSPRPVYGDLREAVHFLVKEPFLGKMQLVGPLMGAVIVPISALIFPAWFIFAQQDSRALGIFLGAGAIGGMAGGVTFAALAQKLPQRTWLVGATGLYASALLGLFFLQPGSIPAIAVSFLAGSMLSVMFAVPYTAFYSRTPQKMLGRGPTEPTDESTATLAPALTIPRPVRARNGIGVSWSKQHVRRRRRVLVHRDRVVVPDPVLPRVAEADSVFGFGLSQTGQIDTGQGHGEAVGTA
jgi:MFS family permease